MMSQCVNRVRCPGLLLAFFLCVSCSGSDAAPKNKSASHAPDLTGLGSIEVTAQLVEIPQGAIFKRDLYDYATVLKYKVLKVHRGKVERETIYVGHYNPFLARFEAADKRVPRIVGNLKSFRAGQVQRMAMEVPIDDHFMGGIVNKYFGQDTGPIYWAVGTNLVSE